MEPDASRDDEKIAEIKNKIRSLSQQMSVDLIRLRELNKQAQSLLKSDPKDRAEKVTEIIKAETSLLEEHTKRVNEEMKLFDELSELRKKRRLF